MWSLFLTEIVRDDPTNNVPDTIFSKLGMQLHRRDEHPLGILKNAIYDYFDINYPNKFNKFDNLLPVVSVKQVSTCHKLLFWEQFAHYTILFSVLSSHLWLPGLMWCFASSLFISSLFCLLWCLLKFIITWKLDFHIALSWSSGLELHFELIFVPVSFGL